MPKYALDPREWLETDHGRIASFVQDSDPNIDPVTVESFGEEWARFREFSAEEVQSIGDEYFDVVDDEMLPANAEALDLGCGSGRWTRYLAARCRHVEAVDPSDAVFTAAAATAELPNVRVTRASVETIPFADGAFDFVLCLGILHHIPDTPAALARAARNVRPGGWMLLYIYYAMENRSPLIRGLHGASSLIRWGVSRLPGSLKHAVCDLLAVTLYLPLVGLARLVGRVAGRDAARRMPLGYYENKSWFVIRNDARDRFGTPLEQRFTREQIRTMMEEAGLEDIRFSPRAPYWHAVGRRAS